MKDLLEIYKIFFKVGALTFGGGYAMLPILQKEIVENKKWNTNEEIMDFYAIGQCTPGIIAVNTSTYIGYVQKKVPGAITAALGVVTPSLIIITIIAAFINNFTSLEIVQNAFSGIKVAVAVLIINAVIKMIKSGVKSKITLMVFIIATISLIFFDISPVYVVIIAAIIGFIFCGGSKK